MARETVAELKARLAVAEKEEGEESVKKFWEQAHETLHDKCFISRLSDSGTAFNYAHYKLYKRSDEYRTEARTVTLHTTIKSRWQNNCGFYCAMDFPRLDPKEPHTLSEVTRKHLREIPKARFEQIWAMVKSQADAMTQQLKAEEGLEIETQPYFDPDLQKWHLDVPHVQVPLGLVHWLEGPYMLKGDRFLVTDMSRQFARAKLAEQRAADRRIEHLTEECDMPYLRQKAAAFKQIEDMLKL